MSEGDEVIVPANTFIASVLAITECKLVPVFAEPTEDTFNLDLSILEKKITKTRAVLIVHLYGRVCFGKKLTSLAKNTI